jgi:ABC-type multidrug transport system fused ATPase/permease subunit
MSAAVATVGRLLTRLVKIAVLGAVLLWISWPLTLAVAAALGVVALLVRPIAGRVEALSRDEVRDWERMAQRMLETLQGMRTIRAFGQERREQRRLERCSAAESRTYERLQLVQAAMPPATELLVGVVMLGVLALTVYVPAALPEVLTFLIVLYRLHPQAQQLDAARVALAASHASVEAVEAFLDAGDKPYVASGPWPCEGVRDAVVFRGVTFQYDPARAPALDAIDLTIPAGRTTVVVGPSGAGKSTLLQLLLRAFDPTAGHIEVDGVPLPTLDLATWRARIAIVPQDVHLFNATIAENIAYGRPEARGTDAIEDAARLADAHDFIRALPDGYATRVGDDGVGLSTGQRQRVALARALVRDPDVLILDEATSAIDPISAAVIQRSVAQLACGRTVVIVTHRLDAMEQADQVVLLDQGRVHEVEPTAVVGAAIRAPTEDIR